MNSPIPEVQALFAVMGVSSITIATIGFCVAVLALILFWFQRRKVLNAVADVRSELSEVRAIIDGMCGRKPLSPLEETNAESGPDEGQ